MDNAYIREIYRILSGLIYRHLITEDEAYDASGLEQGALSWYYEPFAAGAEAMRQWYRQALADTVDEDGQPIWLEVENRIFRQKTETEEVLF